jgi:hypothetical protein
MDAANGEHGVVLTLRRWIDAMLCCRNVRVDICLTEFDWCESLAPSSVRQSEREWLFKSHCTSWSLETVCRQSRMWLKKPNPGLTRYLLGLPRSKLRILVGLITGHCPLNKHLHNMGLIVEPICIACGLEDESAFHLLCSCPSLISLRTRLFSKPILSVEEY